MSARQSPKKWSRPLPRTTDRIAIADYGDAPGDSRYAMAGVYGKVPIKSGTYTCGRAEYLERVRIEARLDAVIAVHAYDDGIPAVTRIFSNGARVVLHMQTVERRQPTGVLTAGEIEQSIIDEMRRHADYMDSNDDYYEEDAA